MHPETEPDPWSQPEPAGPDGTRPDEQADQVTTELTREFAVGEQPGSPDAQAGPRQDEPRQDAPPQPGPPEGLPASGAPATDWPGAGEPPHHGSPQGDAPDSWSAAGQPPHDGQLPHDGQSPHDGQPPHHGQPSAGPAEPGQPGHRRGITAGRNLPAAIGVGVGLGGLALLTLFTVKATFLLYVGAIVALALWELRRALVTRGIALPLIPVVAGGAAMFALAYWSGSRDTLAAMALTVVALLAWRLPGGSAGYVRDVSAGIFALAYLPLLGIFVALMLARPDGDRRVLLFLILTVCSDVGGYAAGILAGRHLMAPVISPKKTWEGLAGSAVFCLAAGAIGLPLLLSGQVWQGLLLGAAAVAAATMGDLAESMIKRDLEIKDMGSVLPGHGGILDRIDSLLVMAPVVWLLLQVFVSNGHAT